MLFKIIGIRDNKEKVFYYDNMENFIYDDDGTIYERKSMMKRQETEEYTVFSPEIPLKKSREVHTLKIQLGLTCNYSCEYCSQRFVERAPETSKKHIESFLEKIKKLDFNEEKGLRIELWGGEPLLYMKTVKPLVAELKQYFSHWKNPPRFSMISNGSLINQEICDWIVENLGGFAISHDGPGQSVRGPDPFEDKELLDLVLKLYDRMREKKNAGMSFNSMVNSKNMSRKDIYDWFVDLTGRKDIGIGEGGFIDAYDEGGLEMSLNSKQKHFDFRKMTFKELYEDPTNNYYGFSIVKNKIDSFISNVSEHINAKTITQKCGMDDAHTIAVDLKGNVTTCQNVSYVSINSNNEPHYGGTIDDVEGISLTSSTHWSQRKECKDCPVLHICRGSCMYAADKYWEQSCSNSYSDNVVFFALAFEQLTGHIPVFFDNEILPDVRKDIWGDILQHPEEQKKKAFPIPVVSA
jgi:uncharacterized protein